MCGFPRPAARKSSRPDLDKLPNRMSSMGLFCGGFDPAGIPTDVCYPAKSGNKSGVNIWLTTAHYSRYTINLKIDEQNRHTTGIHWHLAG